MLKRGPSSELPIKEKFKSIGESIVGVEVDKPGVGKNDVQVFQGSELKEPRATENGTKLSAKAQEPSSRQTVEKKSTLLNPSPMPETKTSVKAGVKTPVADSVSAENGKVVIEKN